MIGFIEDMSNVSNIALTPLSSFSLIDPDPAFKEAISKMTFIIPEFIKFISGDRKRSKVYGNIKQYYPEELVYMNDNILERNVTNIKEIDNIIEDSCTLYKDLRVVILKDNITLSNIMGYDILSLKKRDSYINTIYIQDMTMDTKLAFNICTKLFDKILVSSLYNIGIPVFDSKYIPIYSDEKSFSACKFVVDYFMTILTPFIEKIELSEKEVEDITYNLFKSNFEIMDQDMIIRIYKHIIDKNNGVDDDYDYIGIIMDYQKSFNNDEYIIKPEE